jgi:hypothetical protein
MAYKLYKFLWYVFELREGLAYQIVIIVFSKSSTITCSVISMDDLKFSSTMQIETYYLVLLPALSLNYHKHSDRRIQLELPYHYYWNFDQMSYILQLHTSYICTRGTCTNDRMKWNSFQLIKLNFTIFHSAYWENAPT